MVEFTLKFVACYSVCQALTVWLVYRHLCKYYACKLPFTHRWNRHTDREHRHCWLCGRLEAKILDTTGPWVVRKWKRVA
jgi:hypothetical protein